MIGKIILKIMKNPKKFFLYILKYKIFRLIPDSVFLKLKFYLIIGKRLDMKKPKTFNEKIQWLKIYDRNPGYRMMVDKYLVREYISQKIGNEYLIPLLGVFDNFEEIDFDSLPNQFVLKPNHTSGDIFICHDKSKINYEKLKKTINRWLKREYYWVHREWPYKNIRPRILCEKYMVDQKNQELIDYKFMCFNGKAKCLFIALDRQSSTGLKVDFYDMDWNLMRFERHYPNSGKKIPKPQTFDKMVELSEILAKDLPFVRVDFYEVDGKLYFGELTFYPGSGFEEFEPEKYDYVLGSWLELPMNNAGNMGRDGVQ